jgi:transcriptional regulator GlxA family with amidase domain
LICPPYLNEYGRNLAMNVIVPFREMPYHPAMDSRMSRHAITRRICIVAFPESQILDISGPLAVFGDTSRILQREWGMKNPPYEVSLVSTAENSIITCSCGVTMNAHTDFRHFNGAVDTLLVAGGFGVGAARTIKGFSTWLQRMAKRARRIGSVCSGAMALAEAGLLNGRKATTHWRWCKEIAHYYPEVEFNPDPIFIRDGNVYTSAGVTSGIDLSLALVEEDLGAEVALEIARNLVVFLRRPGSQSQFSNALTLQIADREPMRELQAWIPNNLNNQLTVEELADKARMSPRNFARVFTKQVGTTPARFVMNLRVEAARRMLEESKRPVEQIADVCGFGSTESLRSAFQRVLRVSPQEYRKRFQITASR